MESNGYSLFMDISDPEIRAHSRAASLFTILGMHRKGKKVDITGVIGMTQYVEAIPPQERTATLDKLTALVGGT